MSFSCLPGRSECTFEEHLDSLSHSSLTLRSKDSQKNSTQMPKEQRRLPLSSHHCLPARTCEWECGASRHSEGGKGMGVEEGPVASVQRWRSNFHLFQLTFLISQVGQRPSDISLYIILEFFKDAK